MRNKVEDTKIFRLAAMLYENNNYDIGKDSILRKIIESILVTNENRRLEIIKLIEIFNEEYGLTIDDSEIRRIITEKFNEKFNIERCNTGDSFIISLPQRRYEALIEKQNKYNIINYIDEFIKQNKYDEIKNAKDLILKFLHQLFTSNLNCYEHFLKGKSDTLNYSIDYKGYSNDEIEIINKFLSYENVNKDKAIFDIVNLSLEYCILTGNSNQIYIEGLKNKVFYLDTNIIYRALGINGENRKLLTIKFLEKCTQNGIKVRISKFTIDEFNKSIDYHIKKLSRNKIGNINAELYAEFTRGRDIINMYYEWKSGRQNTDIQHFRAYIKSLYLQLIKDYGIEEDYEVYFDENDESIRNSIEKYSSSISTYKVKESESSCISDAKNILLINKKRRLKNRYSTKFLETRYFMISTDQRLKEWNYRELGSEVPVILLPTQWLNIILRYGSRTNDDYKSFSNFIMLNKIKDEVDKDKIIAILAGISELTEDITYQRMYAEQIIEEKVNSIIEKENIDDVYENTKAFISKSVEEEVKIKESELKSVKDNNHILNETVENQSVQISKLSEIIMIDKRISKLKVNLSINIILSILIILWIGLQFVFLKWNYNIPNKIMSSVSDNQNMSDNVKNILYGINYSILTMLIPLGIKIKIYISELIKLKLKKKNNDKELECLIEM